MLKQSVQFTLFLTIAAAGCAAPRSVSETAATPVEPEWARIPIADGRSVIDRMRARYDGRFLSTLVFRQENTLYPASGGEQKSEWMEYAAFPGRLRVEYLPPTNRSGTILAGGRITAFDNGKVTRSDPYTHPLMVLLYDVNVLRADSTIALLTSLGFNLSLVRKGVWQDRPVFVVGAQAGDTTSNQFWVDAERLVTVRVIQLNKSPSRTVLSETRMDKFVEFAGAPIATEILFLRDGRANFREQYRDVRVNEPLAPELFDPAKWSETGIFSSR